MKGSFRVPPSGDKKKRRSTSGFKLSNALGGIPGKEEEGKFLVDDMVSRCMHVLTIVAPITVAYRAPGRSPTRPSPP